MKALKLAAPGGFDRISLGEVKDAGSPGRGEVRVAIKANSLNFHDLIVAAGLMPTEDGRILLADGAGVVEETGEGVVDFKAGDHVVSTFFPDWLAGAPTAATAGFANVPGDGINGFGCETVVRAATSFTHAPAGWTHAEAATITTAGVTAWRLLVSDGGLKAGETVLVQGTGGVSVISVQIAKAVGARVIATSSSDAKLERIRKLGADCTINYKTHPQWSEQVLAFTDGVGVDHVVEVGGPDTLPESIAATKVGGHIGVIGVLSGMETSVSIISTLIKQIRLQGLAVGSRRDQQEFVRALETTGIKPVIDSTHPAAELADTFRYQQGGKHFGKLCLEW